MDEFGDPTELELLLAELALSDPKIVLRLTRASVRRAIKAAMGGSHLSELRAVQALTQLSHPDPDVRRDLGDTWDKTVESTSRHPLLARQADIERFKAYNIWAAEVVLRAIVLALAAPDHMHQDDFVQHCTITQAFAAKSIELSRCSDQAFGGAGYKNRVERAGKEAGQVEETRQTAAANRALARISALYKKAREAPRGRTSLLAD
jgi:hypothetical protein